MAFGSALAGVVLSLGALSGVLAAAAYILYEDIAAGTLADYQTARSSATLKGELICAIRGAIAADGAVTSGNFGAMLTAISGIAYLPAAVVTTIHDYVNALGATGIMQVQSTGALAVYDCATCTGGFCFTWDFTTLANASGWTLFHGTFVAGVGIQGVAEGSFGGGINSTIYRLTGGAFALTSIEVWYSVTVVDTVHGSHGSIQDGVGTQALPNGTGSFKQVAFFNASRSEVLAQVQTYAGSSAASGVTTIQRVIVRGTGVNPFGTTNCT